MPRKRSFISILLPYLLIAPPTVLVFVLIFLPSVQSFLRTVGVGDIDATGFSFARYTSFFADPISLSNLWFTLEISVVFSIGLFALCLPISLYLRFSRSRIASFVQSLALLPLF